MAFKKPFLICSTITRQDFKFTFFGELHETETKHYPPWPGGIHPDKLYISLTIKNYYVLRAFLVLYAIIAKYLMRNEFTFFYFNIFFFT